MDMKLRRGYLVLFLVIGITCRGFLSAPLNVEKSADLISDDDVQEDEVADVDTGEESGSGDDGGSGSKKEDIESSADGEDKDGANLEDGVTDKKYVANSSDGVQEQEDDSYNKNDDLASSLEESEDIEPSGDSGKADRKSKIHSIDDEDNDDDDYVSRRKHHHRDDDEGSRRCFGGGCEDGADGGGDEHEHHHGEEHEVQNQHHHHGHHHHEHEHHHHGHHHGFIHEWGQEEGGEHHGHEGRGHHEHCHECEREGNEDDKGYETHEKNEGHKHHNENIDNGCEDGHCGGRGRGGGGRGGYLIQPKNGFKNATRRYDIFNKVEKMPMAYHCRDIVSKSGKDSPTKRFCIPVGRRGAIEWPEYIPLKSRSPDKKSKKVFKNRIIRQRDSIEHASKKQTVHVGYGYASGDNYRLGYQANGMGGLASAVNGIEDGINSEDDCRRDCHQPYRKSKIIPNVRNRGRNSDSTNNAVRRGELNSLPADNNGDLNHGGAAAFGHPETHPGFSTMAFPGHAIATTGDLDSNQMNRPDDTFKKSRIKMLINSNNSKRDQINGLLESKNVANSDTSLPYGNPMTHPGYTTMAFPGRALATPDVRNRIARKLT